MSYLMDYKIFILLSLIPIIAIFFYTLAKKYKQYIIQFFAKEDFVIISEAKAVDGLYEYDVKRQGFAQETFTIVFSEKYYKPNDIIKL